MVSGPFRILAAVPFWFFVGDRTDKNYPAIIEFGMGQAERPTCPGCGAYLILALPAGGKGRRTLQCLDCERPDPLKSHDALRWLSGELQPPKGLSTKVNIPSATGLTSEPATLASGRGAIAESIDEPAALLEQIERCRRLATQVHDQATVERLLALAAEYEQQLKARHR
jgi:hypothetical protein